MKKVIISVIIAIAMIAGIFGGVALAAPPDNSQSIWNQIFSGVQDILDNILGLNEDVLNIDDSVSGLSENITKMMSGEGSYVVPSTGSWLVKEIELKQVGHVILTVDNRGFGTSGDVIYLRPYLSGFGPSWVIMDENNPDGPVTVEFAASRWELAITGDGGEEIYYAYSITYPNTTP